MSPGWKAAVLTLLWLMPSGAKMCWRTNSSHDVPVTAGMIWPAVM
ncbi:MAG: hypothetical protein ABSG70_19150 [Terriglobales bacterium]